MQYTLIYYRQNRQTICEREKHTGEISTELNTIALARNKKKACNKITNKSRQSFAMLCVCVFYVTLMRWQIEDMTT